MDLSNAPSPRERERLVALDRLDILDTAPEVDFDELVRLAASALGVESAAISLVDEARQWFKARHGIPFSQTPREVAFCDCVVTTGHVLVVPDAKKDSRFCDNPLVAQQNGIRFYAGMPLFVSGHCVGTLCVLDPVPREELSDRQRTVLEDLARLATDLICSRRLRRMGEIAARVVHTTNDAVVAVDKDGLILYWNPAAHSMFGRREDEVIGKPIDLLLPSSLARAARSTLRAIAADRGRAPGIFSEMVAVRASGEQFPVELSLAPWGPEGPSQGFAAIIRDISARKTLEREREHARSFLDNVVAHLPAMLFVKDVATRRYLVVNQAGETVIGREAAAMIGRTDRELFPDYGAGYEERDDEAITSPGLHRFESAFTRDDGQTVNLRTTRKLIDGPDGPNQYLLGISEDVTLIRRKEAEVLRLAHHDALTGLLNRASFTSRFHRMVQQGTPFALLSIDLDRFKAVNDQFGHLAGDAVLQQVAARLAALLEPDDWLARIGGDEFFAILGSASTDQRARSLCQVMIESIGQPFDTEWGVAHLGVSIGVVLMPQDGATTDQLRENVDLALYRAKRSGREEACFFNAEMDATARDRRSVARDLRQAITAGQIALAYQPVVSARGGQTTSAEALARWTHPERGPVSPEIFIPLAEECGLIDMLGAQLLRRACLDAQTWPETIRVAVNLSPLQFLSDSLLHVVSEALAVSGLRPDRLQLEVTEGLVIRDVEGTFQQLEQLRELGIQVLIDDFGVGYSSLSYFQRFRFDKVKIDKSFIADIAASRTSRAIVQAVVGLGQQLGMGIVAEGVETQEQMEVLARLGCTHLQGYLFSRPVLSQDLAMAGSHSLIGFDPTQARRRSSRPS